MDIWTFTSPATEGLFRRAAMSKNNVAQRGTHRQQASYPIYWVCKSIIITDSQIIISL